MSKPKKIRETSEERAAKVQAQKTAARGERILSLVTPNLARKADRKFGDVAQARAGADVAQATSGSFAGDPSSGLGVSSITGQVIGGRKALSTGLSLAFQRATNAEDTLKNNVIASGTGSQALSNAGLSSLAGTAQNTQLVRAQISQNRRNTLFNAAASIGGGIAFNKLSKVPVPPPSVGDDPTSGGGLQFRTQRPLTMVG